MWVKKLFKRKIKTSEVMTPENKWGTPSYTFTPAWKEERSEVGFQAADEKSFIRTAMDFKPVGKEGFALDSATDLSAFFTLQGSMVPRSVLNWYASQGFIGFQAAAVIAQHWLVNKACLLPAEDSVSSGYELGVNEGVKITPEVKESIKKLDIEYKLRENMVDLIRYSRVFGYRIVLFDVDSEDKEYYQKPFNIDGVKPGSYKGMSQIDPYWITPELDNSASSDPAARDFYEPTWWNVNGRRVHRSHIILIRHAEVPDILKPTYFYGGVSLPQQIYTRVYCAERVADEAPQLALTKRASLVFTDIEQAIQNPQEFQKRMEFWAQNLDNYGKKVLGHDDRFEQHDTSLADLDNVIMTCYQLVAAVAGVPSTKLLGTSPKGFNSSGSFEENSYIELLQTLQTTVLTPLLERHYLLLIRSEIMPNVSIEEFAITPAWREMKVLSAKERAEVNLINAQGGAILSAEGVINADDERDRIITDADSGYAGLDAEPPEDDEDDEDDELLADLFNDGS